MVAQLEEVTNHRGLVRHRRLLDVEPAAELVDGCVWILRGVEDEVDLTDGVHDSRCPDTEVAANERRRPLTGESSDDTTAQLGVLGAQVLLTHGVGHRQNLVDVRRMDTGTLGALTFGPFNCRTHVATIVVPGPGRSVLLNGHSPNESNALDSRRLGTNGRTHTGGAGAPLAEYAGFGSPVLAPADGRIVEVTDGYADTPPGTNGDHPNNLVVDIGDRRYVLMGHLKQGSVTVQVGDVVRRAQPLAAVGNSGHTNEPHLHLQVQDSASGTEDADPTYPMVFRNVHITRGGAWPWGDSRELHTGDLVRAPGQ